MVAVRHASIALHAASCTSCLLCVRECPDWCITVVAHSQADDSAPTYSNARRPSTTKVLDAFTLDFADCMWCGICIEVCPFDALFWSQTPVTSTGNRDDLVADIDHLQRLLPGARRADGTSAPAVDDPPSGRRKRA